MYNVSTGFQTGIKQSSRTLAAKVTINATDYLDDCIVELKYNDTSNPDVVFEIGSVASASIDLSLINVTEVFETATFKPYIGLYVSDKEVASLKITNSTGATATGNVTVTLNGIATTVALATTDNTPDLVATKIRNTVFPGWTTGGTGDTVTFTANDVGDKIDATYSAGTTGATGTMTTTTQGSDGIEYVLLGVFYADTVGNKKNVTTLTLYDGMIKLEQPYFSTLTYPATITDVMNEICSTCGVTFVGTLPTYSIATKPDGYKCREIVGLIAQMCAGFAKFDRDGNLVIKTYTSSTEAIDDSNYFQPPQQKKDSVYRVDVVTCTVNSSTTLTKGTLGAGGSELKFENPFMTDAILTDIYNKLNGFSYLPLYVTGQGNPSTECGDIITVTDVDGTTTHTLPVMRLTLSYQGGLRGDIESEGETENRNQFDSSGSLSQAVARTQYDLEATNARIDNLVVTTAMIDDLSVVTAKIAYGAIGDAQIDRATANKLQVVDGDIVSLNASKVNAGILDTSKVTVQGNNGNLTIQNNRLQIFDNQATPVERVSLGDVNADGTVYGLRVRGADGTTVLYDQDGVYNEGITDGAITNPKIGDDAVDGRVIAAKSVAAEHMVAGTITAASGVIADLAITNNMIAKGVTADKLNVTSLSAITANLGTVTAGTLTGVTINASTFNATYTGGTSTQYGNTKLDSGELYFYEYSNTGGQAYSDIYVNTKHTVDGISYDLERPNIGYKKYTINSNGITYDGSGDQMFGGFHLTVDRATGNVSFASTQGPMTIDTKGGAISNSYFNKMAQYGWSATDTPRSFSGSLQSSFASYNQGFPSQYGMVHWFGSVNSGEDGAGFQLWVPYRAYVDGTPSGDGNLMFRTGRYSNLGWSNWRSFISANSSGQIDQTMTFDGVHYPETNAVDHNGSGTHLYIRPDSTGELRATAKGTTTTYVPVRASSFPTGSLAEYKDNITEWTDSVWDIVKGMTLYKYELKNDIANGITKVRHGFVIGGGYNTPPDLVMTPDQEAVEQYLMNSLSLKHAQESANKIDNHENRLANVETLFPIVNDHESRIAALEAKIA